MPVTLAFDVAMDHIGPVDVQALVTRVILPPLGGVGHNATPLLGVVALHTLVAVIGQLVGESRDALLLIPLHHEVGIAVTAGRQVDDSLLVVHPVLGPPVPQGIRLLTGRKPSDFQPLRNRIHADGAVVGAECPSRLDVQVLHLALGQLDVVIAIIILAEDDISTFPIANIIQVQTRWQLH